MKLFVLLFGLAAATVSFDDVLTEVLTPPDLPRDVSAESLEAELNSRLARLATGFRTARARVVNDSRQLDALRSRHFAADQRIRDMYTEAMHTLQDLAELESISILTVQRFLPWVNFEEALSTSMGVVHNAVIRDNMSRLAEVHDYRADLSWEPFPLAAEPVLAFRERFEDLATEAVFEERREHVERTAIRHLTLMNLCYLRTRVDMILGERTDLLSQLDTAREAIAARLMEAANHGREPTSASVLAQFRRSVNDVAEWSMQRGVDSRFTDAFFDRMVAEGVEELDRLTIEVSEYIDVQTLIPIRADAERRLIEGYTSLRATVRAVRDPEADAATFAALANDVIRVVENTTPGPR